MNLKNYLFTIIILCCFGCKIHFEFAPRKDVYQNTVTDYATINGTYKNCTTDTSKKGYTTPLWQALYPKGKFFMYDSIKHNNGVVNLQMMSHNKLQVQLIENGIIIKTKLIKGKIKEGYFVSRNRVRYFGIPFLFVRQSSYAFRIAKANTNQLYLDAANGRFGWILILATGFTQPYFFTFESSK